VDLPGRSLAQTSSSAYVISSMREPIFPGASRPPMKWGVPLMALVALFMPGAGPELPARNLLNVPHPLVVETMKLFANETKETKAKVWLIHFNHTNPLLWNKDKQKEVKEAGFNFATQGEKW